MVKNIFKGPADRLSEIQLYELVANEIKNGEIDEGLWEKSVADCKADQKQVRGHYSKLRVQMILDERALKEKLEKERLKKRQESYEARQRYEERQSKKKATQGWGGTKKNKRPEESTKLTPAERDWVFNLAIGFFVLLAVIIVFVWLSGGN